MLAARCLQRFSMITLRRCISLSRPSSTTSNRIWKKVKFFFGESEKSNFDEELVSEAYKSDGINMEEWLLIYRDQGATRSFILVAFTFPALLIGAAVIAYDVYNNELKDRYQMVRRLSSDLEEIGVFAVLPGIAFLIVISILLRLQRLQIMRIYQNRMNGEKYIAIGSRNVVLKRQIPFERNCATPCYFSSEHTQLTGLLIQFLVGNMQIKKRRFLISDDGFRANNYRTYMLNETSTTPRL